jgi:DNA-binding NarL/FixJ family response regulator
MTIRIGVLEDEPLFASLFSKSIHGEQRTVEFVASKASEFLSLFRLKAIDCAVLDVHLGEGPSGFEVAQKIRKECPNIGIVFLTSFEDPRLFTKSVPELPVGSRYIVKQKIMDFQEIEKFIDEAVDVPNAPLSGIDTELSELTDHQIEVLRLLAKGMTNSEIASEMFVSEKTVESNISKITKALGLKKLPGGNSRVSLAKLYYRSAGVQK